MYLARMNSDRQQYRRSYPDEPAECGADHNRHGHDKRVGHIAPDLPGVGPVGPEGQVGPARPTGCQHTEQYPREDDAVKRAGRESGAHKSPGIEGKSSRQEKPRDVGGQV